MPNLGDCRITLYSLVGCWGCGLPFYTLRTGENKTGASHREGVPIARREVAKRGFCGVGSDGIEPPWGGAKNRRCITDDPCHNIDIES